MQINFECELDDNTTFCLKNEQTPEYGHLIDTENYDFVTFKPDLLPVPCVTFAHKSNVRLYPVRFERHGEIFALELATPDTPEDELIGMFVMKYPSDNIFADDRFVMGQISQLESFMNNRVFTACLLDKNGKCSAIRFGITSRTFYQITMTAVNSLNLTYEQKTAILNQIAMS